MNTEGIMKNITKVLACGILALGLAACGAKQESESETPAETAGCNPHSYQIVALEAAQLPLTLPDLEAAVINGHYALESGLNEKYPAIAIEEFDAETSVKRTNYIAVKEGTENSDKIKALIAAVTSDEVKNYIENTYKGAVIPSFIDEEGNALASAEINDASGEDTMITVGATAVPHAQILNEVVKGILEKHGWQLDVVEYTDYVQPNTALEAGDLDANYFQTLGYLHNENEQRGLHLKAAAGVHIEPMGVYSQKVTSLSELKDGRGIGVPNDTDNYGRAVELLNTLGLLENAPLDPESNREING